MTDLRHRVSPEPVGIDGCIYALAVLLLIALFFEGVFS